MNKKDNFDAGEESLKIHEKFGGKIELTSTVPLENIRDLSIAYTPGVGRVSEVIGENVELAYKYTIKKKTVAIVSDGSAILGLGDLGPEAALPVMEGKALLLKKFAGLDAFPLCLDAREPDDIVETVKRIAPSFAAINLEDISAPRCFEIEERLRRELSIPVMHDDQHGTSTVVLAGLINALRLRGSKKEDIKVVVSGAGAAGIAVTKLLLEYGIKHIVILDSKGAIYKGREGLNKSKEDIALHTNVLCHKGKDTPGCVMGGLSEALAGADVFIGVSKAGLLKPDMVKTMAKKPIIFALANPVPEIMPDEAKEAGAFIVATGRSDFPNQVNNVLAFPGLFLGAVQSRSKQFSTEVFSKAAELLANYTSNITPEHILPAPFDDGIAQEVAKAIQEV